MPMKLPTALAQTIGAAIQAAEADAPAHQKRTLHPKMVAHARKVAAAHATLSRQPGFRNLSPADQFRQTQAHVRQVGDTMAKKNAPAKSSPKMSKPKPGGY